MLETVWNGSHKHVYLCVQDVPSVEPVDIVHILPRVARAVYHWLPVSEDAAVTVQALAAVIGYEPATINNGLFILRKAGLVQTAPRRIQGQQGRPKQVYWRTA